MGRKDSPNGLDSTTSNTSPSYQAKLFRYPLVGKSFYLDIQDREIVNYLRDKIILLGGQIESVFSPSKVTHIVTNRPFDRKNKRFDDMKSTLHNGKDILEQAILSRKQIYPLNKLVPYLEKRCSEIHTKSVPILPKVNSVNIEFNSFSEISATPQQSHPREPEKIIIFDLPNKQNVIFKEFPLDKRGRSTIPEINLNSPPGYSPFISQSDGEKINQFLKECEDPDRLLKNAQQKRAKQSENRGKKGGWCECCLKHFDCFDEHVTSAQHLSFVRNPENYRILDNLCKELENCKQYY